MRSEPLAYATPSPQPALWRKHGAGTIAFSVAAAFSFLGLLYCLWMRSIWGGSNREIAWAMVLRFEAYAIACAILPIAWIAVMCLRLLRRHGSVDTAAK